MLTQTTDPTRPALTGPATSPPPRRRGRLRVVGAVVAAGVMGPALLGVGPAAAANGTGTPLCGLRMVSLDGNTVIAMANAWNTPARLRAHSCVTATAGPRLRIVGSPGSRPLSGNPLGYPALFVGAFEGHATTKAVLPQAVADPRPLKVSWRWTAPAGVFAAALDLWVDARAAPPGRPQRELQIWLAHRGAVRPAGTKLAVVSVSGVRYQLWRKGSGIGSVVTYQRLAPTTVVAHLDLRAILRDSQARHLVPVRGHLTTVQAGFEVWSGGVGLATTAFAVSRS